MFKLGQRINPNALLVLNYNLKTLKQTTPDPKSGSAYVMPKDWQSIKSSTQPLTK